MRLSSAEKYAIREDMDPMWNFAHMRYVSGMDTLFEAPTPEATARYQHLIAVYLRARNFGDRKRWRQREAQRQTAAEHGYRPEYV